MAVTVSSLFQARCDDRRIVTSSAVDPVSWIRAALPAAAKTHSFHFFMDWKTDPPCVTGPLWYTSLIVAPSMTELEAASDADVRTAFSESGGRETLQELSEFANLISTNIEGILLGEAGQGCLSDSSPSWRVRLSGSPGGQLEVERMTLRGLGELLAQIRGCSANLGSKGLMYGTSAVECYLSRTQNIFPGDCDCLILENGRPRVLLEMKKHTLAGPIGNNLASAYYPKPDGRKYDALFALQSRIGDATGTRVPLAVVYYATKFAGMRVQVIERHGHSLRTTVDSGDVDCQGTDSAEVGARILEVLNP